MQYSPFASIGSANTQINNDFQNSLAVIYLNTVELNYRPAKNIFINIDYINSPLNSYYWNNHYSLWNDF